MNILEEIIANKRKEIARIKEEHPQFEGALPEVPPFYGSVRGRLNGVNRRGEKTFSIGG